MNPIHCITDGHPDSPPLLLLHGFLGSSREFEPLLPHLTPEFYCIRVDLPGHGQTCWFEDYSMQRIARAIVQLLCDRQINQTALLGYSMGGRLALYLALNFPEQFPTGVIESASPGLQTAAEQQARLQQDLVLADWLEADFPQFLAEWYAQPLFASLKRHPSFPQVLEQRLQNHPSELAKSLRGMSLGRQPNLWPQLAAHPHPLLLVVGEYDRKFVALNQAMADLAPMTQLAIVPHSGHAVHVEQPTAFAHCVVPFLQQGHRASPGGQ
ncbi:2-succinyl-6-hydroxy-2,4-cyclohexadiene-1-carboxylate synthase [Leptolyngbya sp. 'hensonii']|uniref:2-succinyl-6-hydroxy-2, 4-cyclohexadiene-1-carboxylate synthase n=1 Tax=Leptolyngbya sp. 'hensonii' TaxID=1922337 RepID=UPI00094F49F7|nr:2-succinyl-6-hydroxy-2,4-cyclohexadiene-1-carboxylate synthase [Leptolyngbya sp. 'hensonii']OLP19190.1 2-succinyl-6-hydroxy-2,4-cyclohexadiene-1-carboxylate synthase [Leptolyngbya sp. 'hensonii']